MTRQFGFVQKTIGIALGVLFAVACGQAPATQAIPESTLGANTPYGSYSYQIVPQGMTPQYFPQWCSNTYFNGAYGVVTTSGSVQVCKHRPISPISGYYSIPMQQLGPSNPGAGQQIFNYYALAGDKVALMYVNGTDGATGSYNCNGCGSTRYTLNGAPEGSATPVTNGGMAAGFTMTDGVKVYLLGANGSATVENSAQVRFGINFYGGNGGYSPGFTSTPVVRNLEVLRCVDIANKTYPCS